MANRKKKKAPKANPTEVWSRRQFIVTTGLGVATLGTNVYGVLRPAPPVQVFVQMMPPARALEIKLEGASYLVATVHDAMLTHRGADGEVLATV